MQNTLQNRKYAKILESRGFYKEALSIYKDLLKEYPSHTELKEDIESLNKKIFKSDEKKRNFFIKMRSQNDFIKFEKWLVKL